MATTFSTRVDLDDDNDGILDIVEDANAFDVFEASFDGSFAVGTEETAPTGVVVSNDGTKLYVIGQTGDDINQYTLTTPFDVTGGATLDGTFSIGTEETAPEGLRFSNDGTKLFVIGSTGDDINQYSLTTRFDLTAGATLDGTFSVATEETAPHDFIFNDDGTKMYVIGQAGRDINQYSLTTPFDVTAGVTFDGTPFSVNAEETAPTGLAFNSDGTKLFVVGTTGDDISVYDLNTAYDLTAGATFDSSFSVATEENAPEAIAFSPDGDKLYVIGTTGDDVNQYSIDIDNDGDGIKNSLDLDSDNDGIADNVEAQTTAGYVSPSGGGAAMTDADQDGLDDNYDADNTTNDAALSAGLTPTDTDADETPDYLDLNSDNDENPDTVEAGVSTPTDATYADVNGSIDDPSALPDTFGTAEVNYREFGSDTDGDRIADGLDLDDDNDGILDTTEREIWEQNVSDATLQLVEYGQSDGAVDTTRTYTALAGGGSDGETLEDILEADRLLRVDTTWTYVLSPAGQLERYATGTGAFSATYTPTALTNGQSGGETYADLMAADRIIDTDGSWLYVLSDDSGQVERYALANGVYNFIFAASVLTNGESAGESVTDLAAAGRLLGMDSSWMYILSDDSGQIERYSTAGAYSTIFTPAALSGGELDGQTLLEAHAEGRIISSNGTDIYVFDSHAALSDTDGDGIDDRLDLDTDGDGIADNVEAQTTDGYIAPSGGGVAMTDADGDGLDDNYDADTNSTDGVLSAGLTPVDTDLDSTPDYHDLNSDAHGETDAVESGLNSVSDATYADVNGSTNNPSVDLPNEAGDTSEVAYRESPDTDGDGVGDIIDLDDDNDGILDTDEGFQISSQPLLDSPIWQVNVYNTTQSGASVPVPVDNQFGITSTDGSTRLVATGTMEEFPNQAKVQWYNFSGAANLLPTLNTNGGNIALTGAEAVTIPYVVEHIFEFGDNNAGFYDIVTQNGTTDDGFMAVKVAADGTETVLIGNPVFSTATPPVNQEQFETGDKLKLLITEYGSGLQGLDIDIGASATTPDGNPQSFVSTRDTDGDGVADHLDLDSDNDGISDLVESGTAQAIIDLDANNDGTISTTESPDDGDGLIDAVETEYGNDQGKVPVDSEATPDGIADVLDLDSDDDGIPDTVEARATPGYAANDGDVTNNDADGDGVLDIFETGGTDDGAFGGAFTTPVNTDTAINNSPDATPDYLDTDSDGDGIDDATEGAKSAINPTYADPDGTLTTEASLTDDVILTNADADNANPDFRSLDVTNAPPTLDLDNNNDSGATDPNSQTTFNIGGNPARIATDPLITDDNNAITQATITLTNPLDAGEALELSGSFGPLTISGSGTDTVTLAGNGSISEYQDAIAAITYNNPASTPDKSDRTISVQVTDAGNEASNTANTTIRITMDHDLDGVIDSIDLDDDNDGILDTVEGGPPVVGGSNINVSEVMAVSGDASYDGTNLNEIQITPDTNGQAGTAMSKVKIDLTQDFELSYALNFGTNNDSNQGDGNPLGSGVGGADGIAFILHNDPAGQNAVGSSGVGIGATGIQNGMAIEFDTFDNQPFGADEAGGGNTEDHAIAWDTDNSTNSSFDYLNTRTNLGEIEDGAWHDVRVTWDATNQLLTYFFDGAQAGTVNEDIVNTRLGGVDSVFFGVSASTGGLRNEHRFRLDNFTGNLVGTPAFRDSDFDGIPDYLDLDSDNDGIADNIEAQATESYQAPSGFGDPANGGTFVDADRDGLDDNYDANTSGAAGSNGLDPVNTDGIDDVDYLDLDSDNDNIFDIVESGLGANDGNGDGRTDDPVGNNGLDNNAAIESADDYSDVNGLGHDGTNFTLADTDNDTAANGSDAAPTTTDLDYRDTVVAASPNLPPDAVDDPVVESGADTLDKGELTSGHNGSNQSVVTGTDGTVVTISTLAGDALENTGASVGLGMGRQLAQDSEYGVNFSNPVDTAEIKLSYVNNNGDGEEEIRFTVLDDNGADITNSVTFSFVDESTVGGLTFGTSPSTGVSNTINALTGSNGEETNGTLSITAPAGVKIGDVNMVHHRITGSGFGVIIENVDYVVTAAGAPYTTDEATVLSIPTADGVIGNDSDPDGDTLTVTEVNGTTASVGNQITLPSGALLTLNNDGSFDYDPNGQYDSLDIGQSDTDTFTYTIADPDGATDTATVTVTINGLENNVNNPPVATPSTSIGDEDTSITVDLVGTDVDGTVDFVTVNTLPPATEGVLTLSDGTSVTAGTPISATDAANLTFTPVADFNGDVTVPFTVTDNDGAVSTPVNEVITVNAVNDAPILDLDGDDSSTSTGADYQAVFTEGSPAVAIADTDTLITDIDGTNIIETATITLTNAQADDVLAAGALPAGITATAYSSATGVLSLSGSASLADYQSAIAAITFENTNNTPNLTPRTIEVVVNDGAADSNIATSTITIADLPPVPTIVIDDITADNIISAAEEGTDIPVTGTVSGEFNTGDTVTLTVNNNPYLGTVDAAGKFSINVPGTDLSADPDITVEGSVTTTDAIGSTGSATDDHLYDVDVIAPTAPVVEIIEDLNNDGFINDAELVGTIEAKVTVNPDVVVGDTLVVTDQAGTELFNGPVTQTIINDGLIFNLNNTADGTPLQVFAQLTDQVGNVSPTATDSALVDDNVPAAPLVVIDEDINDDGFINDDEIDGTVQVTVTPQANTEVGDTMVVTLPDGTELFNAPLTQAQIDDGITFDLTAPTEGNPITVDAIITDPAGNVSPIGTDTAILDTTAPAAPTVVITEDANNDGLISDDELVGTVEVAVSVPPTAEVGDVLVVTDQAGNELFNAPVTQPQIDNGLVFSVTGVVDGSPIEVTATLTDPAGNVSPEASDTAVLDLSAPSAPTVIIDEDTNNDGFIDNDELDGDIQVTVELPNDVEVGDTLVVTDQDGNVLFNAPVTQDHIDNDVPLNMTPPANGTPIEVTAIVTDAAGNESPEGTDAAVLDAVAPPAPIITITEDIDNNELIGASELVGNIDIRVELQPGTEVGDELTVSDQSGNTLFSGPVNQFQIDNGLVFNRPSPGEGSTLTVFATVSDEAGNTSSPTSTDTATIDTIAPGAPTVTITEDTNDDGLIGNPELSGPIDALVGLPTDAKPGDTLLVTDQDGTELFNQPITQADIDNGVTVEVPNPGDGSPITVTAQVTDEAGNPGPTADDTALLDLTAPTAPIVTITEDANDDALISNAELSGPVEALVEVPDADVGDILIITDQAGTELYNAPVTLLDIANGVEVTPATPAEGDDVVVTATLTDPAGNISAPGTDAATLDTTPPSAPTVVINEDINDDGLISDGELDGPINATVEIPTDAEVGDTLTVVDQAGNVLFNEPITQGHIDNGVPVEALPPV